MINKGDKNIIDALYGLTNHELNFINERAKITCVKVANFPKYIVLL